VEWSGVEWGVQREGERKWVVRDKGAWTLSLSLYAAQLCCGGGFFESLLLTPYNTDKYLRQLDFINKSATLPSQPSLLFGHKVSAPTIAAYAHPPSLSRYNPVARGM
jgi:hypothetical protein